MDILKLSDRWPIIDQRLKRRLRSLSDELPELKLHCPKCGTVNRVEVKSYYQIEICEKCEGEMTHPFKWRREQAYAVIQIADVKSNEWYKDLVGELFEVNGIKLVDWIPCYYFLAPFHKDEKEIGFINKYIQLDHAEIIFGDEEMLAFWYEESNNKDNRVFTREKEFDRDSVWDEYDEDGADRGWEY